MQENIKHHLDSTVPKHITLTEVQKRKILNEANNRMNRKNPLSHRLLKPLLSGVAIIGISGILAVPYIQDWLEERAFQQSINESLKEVTITGVDYSSLIGSIYVDDTNELIYTDHDAIYSYSVTTETKRILVEPKENAQIFKLAVNENWLVWEENSTNKSYILNRTSNEIKELSNKHTSDLQLEGDTLTYLSFGNEDRFSDYKMIDLASMEETKIHEQTGDGANSKAAVNDGLMVIPEKFKTGDEFNTTFFLYDLNKQVKVEEFEVPYEFAVNVTLTNNKVFAQLYNEGEKSILAYIDLEDSKFHKLNVPAFEAYAVYEDYVALSVPKNDSNTVKLYQIEKDSVVALSTFNQVKERLVKPRFTDNGIFVVNGEGEHLSMYLQDVNLLK